jgi:hypothetical protein
MESISGRKQRADSGDHFDGLHLIAGIKPLA